MVDVDCRELLHEALVGVSAGQGHLMVGVTGPDSNRRIDRLHPSGGTSPISRLGHGWSVRGESWQDRLDCVAA